MRFSKLLLVAITAVVLSTGCETGGGGQASDWPDSLPDEIVGTFMTEETDSGRVKWKLSSPEGRRFEKQQVFLLQSPVIQFYDGGGALHLLGLLSDGNVHSHLSHFEAIIRHAAGQGAEGRRTPPAAPPLIFVTAIAVIPARQQYSFT